MNTKHTPGPWIYEPESQDYRNAPYMVWTSKGPGYGTIAETNPTGLLPTSPDEQAANARLIAAAPDLLAACQEALTAIDEAYQATGHVKIAKTSKQRLRIEAAIAKATPSPSASGHEVH